METDLFTRFLGVSQGSLPWTLAWVAVAVGLFALGGFFYWLIGRFHSGMVQVSQEAESAVDETEPKEDDAEAPVVQEGGSFIPPARVFAARLALVRVAQVLFLLLFVDLSARLLVALHPVDWSVRGLRGIEALVLSVLVLRFVHALAQQTPAAIEHLKSLQGSRIRAWNLRNTQVLSDENVTGLAIAMVRLGRFAFLITVYYWIIAFLWATLEGTGQDIRPTLLGLIFAIVIWQAFIWFDRIFPFLEEVVEGWQGSILKSIPFRGHAFITEQHSTQAVKSLLLLLRVAISASFFASFCIYVLSTLPMEQAWGSEIRSFQYVLVITAAAWILMLGLIGLRNVFELRLPQWKGTLIKPWNYQRTEVMNADRLMHAYGFCVRWAFIVCAVLLSYFYATLVFSFFETTSHWAEHLVENVKRPIVATFLGIWNYLPHLFAVVVIFVIARTITRIVRWFFVEIEEENLRFSGFYPEWAMPTYQLVRLVIIIFTLIAIFPHLPGADTSHFKGISVFIGLIISLGGSGTVGHAVSGVMLTYMRPFQVGDRVQIAETVGDVMEKTILVTRVRTSKNVDITIPNGTVLSSHIVNFSAAAQEEGVILHTAVTLGYDVPWRKIHEIMVGAASATDGILEDPAPFVLQTALEDHCVRYELNGHTREPSRMSKIYSDLHARMQDDFSKAGIEILSPVYEAARDGSASTLPTTD